MLFIWFGIVGFCLPGWRLGCDSIEFWLVDFCGVELVGCLTL